MSFKEEVMKKYLIDVILIVCLLCPVPALAGVPLDTVKGYADKVLDVLRDPALKA